MNKIFKTILPVFIFVLSFSVAQAQYPNIDSINVDISPTSANLKAQINPNGYVSTAWFEYGTNSNLNTYAQTEHVALTNTNNSLSISRTITGLTPNTTYYFRVVTDNGRNTLKGSIAYFVTSPQTQTYTNTTYTNQTNTNTYQNNTYRNQTASTIYSTNNSYSYRSTGNVLFGNGFLPNNIFGWFILILVVIAIIVVVRRIARE